MHTNPVRTPLSAVVRSQLPEFIREDYPTFVAFVEAYYDYLKTQGVDLTRIRDIDTTLEDFIGQFKKELAYNLPLVVEDERFLLSHIRDQYLSKGSAASYKLLFKLLYGKQVELTYPNQSMLRASDGRWNQEISIFAQVDYGDPDDIVGKLVDIQTAGRILRVLVDKKEQLIGEIDRIVKIGKSYEINASALANSTTITVTTTTGIEVGQLVTGYNIFTGSKVVSIIGNIVTLTKPTTGIINTMPLVFSNELYEFFLDKRFFGKIKPGDLIKYKDTFQAKILPATQTIAVSQPGKYFRLGQVFELKSGAGTGALMKVTATTQFGGIKYAELIRFGLGYNSDFALSILASNDVIAAGVIASAGTASLLKSDTYTSTASGTITASPSSLTVTGSSTTFGLAGGVAVGDEIWTTNTIPLLIGVVKSIESAFSLTLASLPSSYESGTSISSAYTAQTYTFRNIRLVGSLFLGNTGGTQAYTNRPTLSDYTDGFNEQGYINSSDYFDYYSSQGFGTGTITATTSSSTVTGVGTAFTTQVKINDILKNSSGVQLGIVSAIASNTSLTLRNSSSVAVTGGTYDIFAPYVDGSYVGTVLREFSLSAANAQTYSDEPAVIYVKLGALVRYPGYFETNNGFLSDSMFIQDSKFYQAFSYVIKIDERLASYKSAVKTMLHPAGMALFGEFNITNEFDLSVQLESLVKSMGIGLEEEILILDGKTYDVSGTQTNGIYWTLTKGFVDAIDVASGDVTFLTATKRFGKQFENSYLGHVLNDGVTLDTESVSPTDLWTHQFSKDIRASTGFTNETVTMDDSKQYDVGGTQINGIYYTLGKNVSETYSGLSDAISKIDVTTLLADTSIITEMPAIRTDKYLGKQSVNSYVGHLINNGITVDTETLANPTTTLGEIWMNSYQGQDYYSQEYSEGLTQTFTA
jgi:hypothetical protein